MDSLNPRKQTKVQLPAMYVDAELTDRVSINVFQKRQFPKGTPPFVMLFQAVNKIIAMQLSPSACKVLLYLIACLEFGNHAGVNQLTISEELKFTERTVRKAIAELKKLKIITDYADLVDKRRKVYIINPHQSWKGDCRDRLKVIKADQNQFKLPFPINIQVKSKLKYNSNKGKL